MQHLENDSRFFRLPYERTGEVEFKKLSKATKVLYLTLCRLAFQYANKEGWFFRSMKSLCDDANLSDKSVTQGKIELEHLDLIEIKRGKRHSDNYRSADAYRINGIRQVCDNLNVVSPNVKTTNRSH